MEYPGILYDLAYKRSELAEIWRGLNSRSAVNFENNKKLTLADKVWYGKYRVADIPRLLSETEELAKETKRQIGGNKAHTRDSKR